MESKEGCEDPCNTTEDETLAYQRKRARRVSFADITSVHVFDRDEDLETPPDSKPSSEPAELAQGCIGEGDCAPDGGGSGEQPLHRDSGDGEGNGDGDEEEDEDEDGREPFVRNMDFSSPGSTVGSAASNDEENFFGPVSSSFIRPGRLSTESAVSDYNHDVTMDSTAFSLHFHCLMQSDERTKNLGGDFETPIRDHLPLEEKTPTGDSIPTNAGSFVLLTGIKRLIPQCPSNERSSFGGNSDDMSLIVEDLHRYDYGRLSPSLDALLTEGQKDCNNKGGTIKSKVPFNTSSNSSDVNNHYRVLNNDQFSSSLHCLGKMNLPDDGALGNHSHIHGDTTKKAFYCMGKESCKDTPEAGKYLASSVGKHGTSPSENLYEDLIIDSNHELGGYTKEGLTENNYFPSSSPVPMAKNSSLTPSNDLDMLVASPKERRCITDDNRKAVQEPQALSPESARLVRAKRQDLFCDGQVTPVNSLERLAVSSKERKTPDDSQLADENPRSLSQDSAFSLRVKRQHLFLDSDVSFRSKLMISPSARGHPPFTNEEEINAAGTVTSTKNITSMPMVCEPCSVENSKPVFQGLFGNSSPCKGSFGKNSEDPEPSAVLLEVVEGHMLDAAQKNTSPESLVKMFTADSKRLNKIDTVSGDSLPFLWDGEYKKQVNTSSLNSSQDRSEIPGIEKDRELKPSNFHFPIAEMMSTPLHNSTIEEIMSTPLPTSTIEEIMSTPLHQSPQSQRRVAQKEINQAGDPHKLISSPAKMLDQKISAAGWQKGLLRTPNQQRLTDKFVLSTPRQQMPETRTGTNADLFTTMSEVGAQSNSLVMEHDGCSTKALADINSTELSFVRQKKGESKSFHNSLPKEFDLSMSFQTPLSSSVLLSSRFHSQDRYLTSTKDHAKLGEMISPEVQLKASACESAPPEVSKKNSMGLVGNSHGELTHHLADGNDLRHLSQKYLLSPIMLPGRHGHELGRHLQQSLFVSDIGCSGNRRSQQISSMDKEENNATGWSRKRLCQAAEMEDSNSHFKDHVTSSIEDDKINGETSLKDWKDVFSKFSAATEELLPTSVNKLSTHEIGILEDMLCELWKAKMFEKLCCEIKFQKTAHHLSKMQQERVVEATQLQHMLVYERAKLQLLHAKRDELLKHSQQLKAGIEECCNIQSILQNDEPDTREVHNKDAHVQPLSTGTDSENQGVYHRLIARKKEYGVMKQKLESLIKYFHYSFKLKGDPGNVEMIALVDDHLQKQSRSLLLRQYLQLWVLDDIQTKDDHRNIVLDYHGLISQRFTMKNAPASSMTSINWLNNANISKIFPNMEVSTAFEFVFSAKNGNWIGNPKGFLQVTEATSFLLGNLLDVVEEAQVARLELPNLISTNFHSPCVGQLELQLCFVNFSTGRKATLLLDMSGLKCGIYPSEILPPQLKVQISGEQTEALLSQILDEIRGLKSRYHSKIIDLCHSVSKLVQASI